MWGSQPPLTGLVFESASPARPILKWAGGKQQMLDHLLAHVPAHFNTYIEPFFGGGALFFALRPRRAIIADSNPELINLYRVVASNVEALIAALAPLPLDEDSFYRIRDLNVEQLDPVARAARTIYLNRTCFNGLYRVNRKGQFNTPYGRYTNPTVCDPVNLRAASVVLAAAEIILADYKDVLHNRPQPGDFVFLDPPYLPVAEYSDFKRYTKEQFREQDHRELAIEVRRLHELGCHVLLTNSNHPLVQDLYGEYQVKVYQTLRLINKDAGNRTGEDTLVIIPSRQHKLTLRPVTLPEQMKRFPPTRFMGSKSAIL
ncbi:MAG: DNA adenine methylase, partial [Chloroflexi bacterium]|nr:DNA adenine methylase [Chloroflexota bacterium]